MRLLRTKSSTPQWESSGRKQYFLGWSLTWKTSAVTSAACLPARLVLAWRKLSGCVSSGVYSASQTNELRSWAGFQACKGQKTIIHKSRATTLLSPLQTIQLNHRLPTSRFSYFIVRDTHIPLFVLTAQRGKKNQQNEPPPAVRTVALTDLSSVALGKIIWID